ncbi:DNA primase [Brevibacterium litoralis]|uniref:DNA primase n=1 Tax=Brevibacterium litoralis TaxID=3138935 RepID=UPI0032EB23E8
MPQGLIRREDIDEVRSRVRIDEVIGEYVTLKNAGIGALKGLCPFHDERTPSFNVRPQVGMYHCFGCGESGDVFTFLQKLDGLTFVESVERLAGSVGVQLQYEEGSGPDKEEFGRRQRLIDMHQVAGAFFEERLRDAEAQAGRDYLSERGFDAEVCARYGIGYAPNSWDALLKHLRTRGFRNDEIAAAGLVSEGQRGVYDRFRGRLTWPIRDVTGRTIGFGARRLREDDKGPKYLNTPETALYKKNQVLYGLDLAKRAIAKNKRVVIVEGYTDVMAAHLSGIEEAVATCGTAFGAEHIKIVRRLLGDDSQHAGTVIFTFDGDEAGQAAALKAFREDQKFVSQTFVAVAKDGMDPCDLRMQRGEAAVRDLVESRKPLFEFALDQTIADHDLDTAEGRVRAIRAAAPLIAQIRDAALRPEYERIVAGHIGVDTQQVTRAVLAYRKRSKDGDRSRGAPHSRPDRGGPQGVEHARGGTRPQGTDPGAGSARPYDPSAPGPRWTGGRSPSGGQFRRDDQGASAGGQFPPEPDADRDAAIAAYAEEIEYEPLDPTRLKIERGALMVALQEPTYVNAKLFDNLNGKVFSDPAYREVHQAMKDAGGVRTGLADPSSWPEKVLAAADERIRGLVGELTVQPLPAVDGEGVERYSRAIIARLFDKDMERIAGELHSRLQRTAPEDFETTTKLLDQLQVLERQRGRLKQMM